MPYYFLIDEFAEEHRGQPRPTGPLLGEYLPERVNVEVSDPQPSRLGAFFSAILRRKKPAPEGLRKILAELQTAGVTEIECRYDGGNDEGFAYFERAMIGDAVIEKGEIARILGNNTVLGDPTYHAFDETWSEDVCREILQERASSPKEELAAEWLDACAGELACLLLGGGFGNGPCALEGRFRFNLMSGELVDLQISPPPDFRNSDAFDLDELLEEE